MVDDPRGFLALNLCNDPQGRELDPAAAIERLKARFPGTVVPPGDQSAAEAARAEAYFAGELQVRPDGPAASVIRSLRRKAETHGPTFAFRIPMVEGRCLTGYARRTDITFLFDFELSEGLRHDLLGFLREFGAGKIERENGHDCEVVEDLG